VGHAAANWLVDHFDGLNGAFWETIQGADPDLDPMMEQTTVGWQTFGRILWSDILSGNDMLPRERTVLLCGANQVSRRSAIIC